MLEMREIEVKIGQNEYLPDGTKIETDIIDPLTLADGFSDTAHHEVLHAATAPDKVESVSIVPGPGYAGITKFTSFDSAAAAAPHAHGKSGTGWDTALIEYHGDNVASSSVVARMKLAGKGKHIEVLARYLEARKTISGSEVREVMSRVDQGENVEVKMTKPDGSSRSITEKGVRGEVVIVDFTNVETDHENEERIEQKDTTILKFPSDRNKPEDLDVAA